MLYQPFSILFFFFKSGEKKGLKLKKTISITVGGVSSLLLSIPPSYCTVCSSIGSSFIFIFFYYRNKNDCFEVRDFD